MGSEQPHQKNIDGFGVSRFQSEKLPRLFASFKSDQEGDNCMFLLRLNPFKSGFLEKMLKIAIGVALIAAPAFTFAQSMDCTLIVPPHPLSATGLSTPYQLVATNPANGPCNEANKPQSAFVQAAILDKDTGQISIYNPLIIDQGTTPAAAPVVPVLPTRHIVALWFGFNANNLSLVGQYDDLEDAHCVQGLGQFAYCNAPLFFAVANEKIYRGLLKVPPLGVSPLDNQPCPTTRSFAVVDQDQSDNITTSYLANAAGQMAQNNAANRAALAGATVIANPSDNRLTDVFLDPALGCKPWMVADITDPAGAMIPALPLNELQAAAYQKRPIARVPAGDPFVLKPAITGVPNLRQVNRYRRGVDQQLADDLDDANTTTYCKNLRLIQPAKLALDQTWLVSFKSPDPAAGNSLFTFMAQRYVATYQNLNCQTLLNLPVNITVTTDAQGVATSATITK
jgi:hypothetical protein